MVRRFLLVALLGIMGIPAMGEAATVGVKATDYLTWSPKVARVVKGDRVTFKNPTFEPHDFKPYKGPWNNKSQVMLEPGDSVKRRFTKKGKHLYRCTLHSSVIDGVCDGMCGIVRVRTG